MIYVLIVWTVTSTNIPFDKSLTVATFNRKATCEAVLSKIKSEQFYAFKKGECLSIKERP